MAGERISLYVAPARGTGFGAWLGAAAILALAILIAMPVLVIGAAVALAVVAWAWVRSLVTRVRGDGRKNVRVRRV